MIKLEIANCNNYSKLCSSKVKTGELELDRDLTCKYTMKGGWMGKNLGKEENKMQEEHKNF